MSNSSNILFADRIRGGLPMVYAADYNPRLMKIGSPLEGAEVIDFTNVTDYYFQHGVEKFGAHELFNVMPPFSQVWMETSNANVAPGDNGIPNATRSGVVFVTDKVPAKSVRSSSFIADVSEWETLYVLNALVFQFCKNSKPLHFQDGTSVSTDYGILMGTGNIILNPHGKPVTPVITPKPKKAEFMEISQLTGAMIATEVFSALLAFQFLHCKNVGLATHEPSPALSKSFKKRHGQPLLSYKTLEIGPAKQVLESEGDIGHNGIKKALHICRGHFATYTPEKGMLGRPLTEPVTVWKPAHVRGDSKHGIAAKDYKVKG